MRAIATLLLRYKRRETMGDGGKGIDLPAGLKGGDKYDELREDACDPSAGVPEVTPDGAVLRVAQSSLTSPQGMKAGPTACSHPASALLLQLTLEPERVFRGEMLLSPNCFDFGGAGDECEAVVLTLNEQPRPTDFGDQCCLELIGQVREAIKTRLLFEQMAENMMIGGQLDQVLGRKPNDRKDVLEPGLLDHRHQSMIRPARRASSA